jgi:NAD(P)-dependent dehydrogenase (short-subunit alcohol dehydrogenase family)
VNENNQGSVMPNTGKPLPELFDLSGKVALVTGGAGDGYGMQVTGALAEAGAHVIITSRDFHKAQQSAQSYRANGLVVDGKQLELKDEKSVSSLVAELLDVPGRVDILFNNAAENCMEPLETFQLADWNRVLAANITGTMLISREVAPHMITRGSGVIVNLSSIYGVVAPDHRIYGKSRLNSPLVYGISKAAIIQMTRYLAVYWRPHIRVNCITAGGLFNRQDPEFVSLYVDRTPLGRMAGPDDLKGIAVYLASDASAWVTGQNFIVDGGWTTW